MVATGRRVRGRGDAPLVGAPPALAGGAGDATVAGLAAAAGALAVGCARGGAAGVGLEQASRTTTSASPSDAWGMAISRIRRVAGSHRRRDRAPRGRARAFPGW